MKSNRFSIVRRRVIPAVVAVLGAAVMAVACSTVEGARCNPALTHDECDNAPTIQCVQVNAAPCNGEAYCCPVDSAGNPTGSDPNCMYLLSCLAGAAGDAGTAGDAAGD